MAKKINDPRIGHEKQWPETTMGGANYRRPATTIALGNGYFCVADTFMKVIERAMLVGELKALIAGADKVTVLAKKQDKGDDDGLA